MTRRSLTPKPAVPAFVRVAAIGTLAWSPISCGGDDDETIDQFPTDACLHAQTDPNCQTTNDVVTASDTDDVAPTIPCAHDPNACESTGPDGSTGTTAAESGTTADTDTDTGGSSSGSSTGGSDSGTSSTGGA